MKFKKNIFTAILLTTALVACGSSSSKKKEPIKETVIEEPTILVTTGIWHAPAYGLVFDVSSDDFEIYQTTTNFCQRFELEIDHADLLESMIVSEEQTTALTTIAGLKVPGITIIKQESLPDICINDLLVEKGEVNYQFNAQQEFEIFWQTFDEYYAFFKLESVDWSQSYQLTNNQITSSTSEVELFELLATMIAPLKDFHVSIENESLDMGFGLTRKNELDDIAFADFVNSNNYSAPFTAEQIEAFEEYYDEQRDVSFNIILAHASDDFDVKTNENDNLVWGITDDNLGYLWIETMDVEAIGGSDEGIESNKIILADTLDQIMNDFADVDGIMIDVRYNGGGDDFVSQMIVSRFIAQDLHAYSKQARLGNERTVLQDIIISPEGDKTFIGPVTVLTSMTTSSAAEVFAMSMREREKTILVGEATGGGFSDILPKTLPHGLIYSISNEFYLTPAGEEFEGLGVPVNIEQAFFTLAQRESGVDLGVISAIDWLLAQE